jgi:hypothetical protein
MYSRLLAQGIPITNPAINTRIGIFYNVQNSAGVIQTLLRIIINMAFALSGLYFFFSLILGGYSYITAGGDKESVQKASSRIRNSIIGVIVILSVFVITYIVETLFGFSILLINLPNV